MIVGLCKFNCCALPCVDIGSLNMILAYIGALLVVFAADLDADCFGIKETSLEILVGILIVPTLLTKLTALGTWF